MPVHQGPRREVKIRPAIDELTQSHEALFEELEAGFDDRRDLVLWIHKASARTLGRIPDEWPQQLLGSRYQTAGMLNLYTDEVLGVGSPTTPSADLARFERAILRDDTLLEACTESMRYIAQRSTQYTDGSSSEEATKNRRFGPQRWLLMMPSFDELVSRQRTALMQVLGLDPEFPRGLESHEDVARWVRGVIQASRGIDGGLSREALWSPWWRQTLTDDPRHPDLHLLLADEVLGVFNAALREEASQADEAPDDETPKQRAFNT